MPELPEVETTTRGIKPHLIGGTVKTITIRQTRLRWPIERRDTSSLHGQKIIDVYRRAKYIILAFDKKTWAIIHLGMSGSLRILDKKQAPGKHEHFDILLDHGKLLRYKDPRRFGCFLICTEDPASHRLLHKLGPEPLSSQWNTNYLYQKLRTRRSAIKTILMQQETIVGIGNIYANEALFLAGIAPHKLGHQLSKLEVKKLIISSKDVLKKAILAGGTTLQDFTASDGKPGYFQQQLYVYGQAQCPCAQCSRKIKQMTIGQRSTFYCSYCQK